MTDFESSMGESRLLQLQMACGWSDAQLSEKLGFSGNHGRRDIDAVIAGESTQCTIDAAIKAMTTALERKGAKVPAFDDAAAAEASAAAEAKEMAVEARVAEEAAGAAAKVKMAARSAAAEKEDAAARAISEAEDIAHHAAAAVKKEDAKADAAAEGEATSTCGADLQAFTAARLANGITMPQLIEALLTETSRIKHELDADHGHHAHHAHHHHAHNAHVAHHHNFADLQSFTTARLESGMTLTHLIDAFSTETSRLKDELAAHPDHQHDHHHTHAHSDEHHHTH